MKVEVSWGRLLRGHSRGGLGLLQLEAFFSSFDRFAVASMLLTIAVSLRGRSPIVCFFSFHEDGKLPWPRSKGRVVNTCYFNGVGDASKTSKWTKVRTSRVWKKPLPPSRC